MAEPTKSPSMKLMKSNKKAVPAEAPEVEKAEAPAEVLEKPDTSVAESEDLIVSTVAEVENLKEDKAFKLVPQLLNNIDHDYFRLGGVLSVIQQEGWYMDQGFENFRQYIEVSTGMQYRKAMYLIQIYNGLATSGVEWAKVKHLGWTKLKELSGILTPDNVDEWVEEVSEMTVLQLQEFIKAQSAADDSSIDKADAAEEATKTSTMSFKVHKDQKETIREALDKAKQESGTDVDTVALENICLDYLAGSKKGGAAKAKPATLEEVMKGKSAEDILTVFGELFPDVELEVTLPE